MRPAQQLELSTRGLDQRRARFDPVAGVAVERSTDAAQVGTVNVPAHHAVVTLLARMSGRHALVLLDVAQARRDTELDALGQRPVGLTEAAAQIVDAVADTHRELVERIPEAREPRRAAHRAVELVAVQDQQPLAARRTVHPLAVHFEMSLQHPGEHPEALVVVARDVDAARAGARSVRTTCVCSADQNMRRLRLSASTMSPTSTMLSASTPLRNSLSSRARAWRYPR